MLEISIPEAVAGQRVALRVRGDIPPWMPFSGGQSILNVATGPSGGNFSPVGTGRPIALVDPITVVTTSSTSDPNNGAGGYYSTDSDGNRITSTVGFDFTTPQFTAPASGSLYLYNTGAGGSAPTMVIRGLWWTTTVAPDPFDNIVTGKRNVRAHFVG